MVTTAVAAVSLTTADVVAEEIPEMKADAETGNEIETGMIPAGKEGLTRSHRPEAHAGVRKKNPR